MKKICLMLLLALSAVACNEPINNEVGKVGDNLLQSFTVVVSDQHYKANIDYTNKTITYPMITSPREIDAVLYNLNEGASILPEPSTVEKWAKEQTFVVSSGNQSEAYKVLLPNLRESKGFLSVAYIASDYHTFDQRIGDVPWQHITHLCVAHLMVCADGSLDASYLTNLPVLTELSHANNVKIMISLSQLNHGDWPKALATPALRTKVVDGILKYVEEQGLDGVDVDYEHYATWDQDFANTLAFVKELSEKLKMKDANMLMAAATNANYEYGTEFHKYFDFINLMIYDGNGTGRGIPVHHGTWEQWEYEFDRWLNDFNTPREKLIGGIPLYGYTWDTWSNPDAPLRESGHTVTLASIQEQYPDINIVERDRVGNTLYNGRDIIRGKCEDVIDKGYGGVMVWQVLQDVINYDDKMMKVIGETLEIE